jgi:hypothetical protein
MAEIIKVFKEYHLKTILDYFKNELILLNNILELSKNVVFNEEDLTKFIYILVTNCDISRIRIDHDIPDAFKTCGCCEKLPIYPSSSTTRTTSKSITTPSTFRRRANLTSRYNTDSQINYVL